MVGGIEVDPSPETLERERQHGKEESHKREGGSHETPSSYTPALPGRVLYISRRVLDTSTCTYDADVSTPCGRLPWRQACLSA